jgi:hypothetical protein
VYWVFDPEGKSSASYAPKCTMTWYHMRFGYEKKQTHTFFSRYTGIFHPTLLPKTKLYKTQESHVQNSFCPKSATRPRKEDESQKKEKKG